MTDEELHMTAEQDIRSDALRAACAYFAKSTPTPDVVFDLADRFARYIAGSLAGWNPATPKPTTPFEADPSWDEKVPHIRLLPDGVGFGMAIRDERGMWWFGTDHRWYLKPQQLVVLPPEVKFS